MQRFAHLSALCLIYICVPSLPPLTHIFAVCCEQLRREANHLRVASSAGEGVASAPFDAEELSAEEVLSGGSSHSAATGSGGGGGGASSSAAGGSALARAQTQALLAMSVTVRDTSIVCEQPPFAAIEFAFPKVISHPPPSSLSRCIN